MADTGAQRPENASQKPENMDKQTLYAVLQFLKKNQLKETEELLKKEANISEAEVKADESKQTVSNVSHALAAYKSEGDPSLYEDYYVSLKEFIESSLDVHKCELSMVLYPVFVHMYLELVYNEHEDQAKDFFGKFCIDQEHYYEEDMKQLSTVTKSDHMHGNQLLENFKGSKFTIRMSRDSYNHLKRHLLEKKQSLLLNIYQEHLFIDVFDGTPRTKEQIDSTSGGMSGEANKDANKTRVYFGLLKEPDINIPLEDEEDGGEGEGDKPKKKKAKKDPLATKKAKNDPNAPSLSRVPLPELKDNDKLEKVKIFREMTKRVNLGLDKLPSICFYTFLNAYKGVTSVNVCDDSSLLAAGFADSSLRVFSLTPNKLRSMKPPDELNLIDKEADDVLERIMDDRTASDNKSLHGHSGPVYATSFTPDRNLLTSSSADGTIRLWSLVTWTNLVCYKGHNYPVWDCQFSPHGNYFASGGHDRTARLWSTDHYQPVRIFAGHLADVDSVQFHPNSNYIATGSTDRTVRLWDVHSGQCVRTMTGHKGPVHRLAFSTCGKYLASAGTDKVILLWDVSTGELVGQLAGHTDTVYALAFSREGALLASGGLDSMVKIWDIAKLFSDIQDTDFVSLTKNENNYELGSYPTKNSPILCTHFTRRNLLLASGPYINTFQRTSGAT